MNPPKGLSGRDSFSVSQQTDIYIFIQKGPMAPKNPVKEADLDTLENQKIKKSVQGILIEKSDKPIYLVIKSLKILIKGFIFPVHLFLFRLPRWFFLQALSKIFSSFYKIGEGASDRIKENFGKMIQEIKKRAQVLLLLTEALKPLSKMLKTSLDKLKEGLKEHLFVPLKTINLKIAKKIIEKLFKLNETLQHKLKTLSFLWKNSSSFLWLFKSNSLFLFSNFIKKTAKTIEVNTKYMFLPVQKAYISMKKIYRNLKIKLEKNSLLLKKINNKNKEFFNKIRENLKAPKIFSKINIFRNPLDFFILPKVKETVAVFAFKCSQQLTNAFNSFALNSQILRSQFFLSLKKRGASLFKLPSITLNKIKIKINNLHLLVKDFFKKSGKDVFDFFKKSKNKIGQFLEKRKKQTFLLKEKCLSLSKKVNDYLKACLIQIYHLYKKLKRFSILLFRWCRIMTKFTGYLIKEIFRELQAR